MWEKGARIYDTPGVPNNFPQLKSNIHDYQAYKFMIAKVRDSPISPMIAISMPKIWTSTKVIDTINERHTPPSSL